MCVYIYVFVYIYIYIYIYIYVCVCVCVLAHHIMEIWGEYNLILYFCNQKYKNYNPVQMHTI